MRLLLPLALLAAFLLATTALAEVPLLTPAEMQKQAGHIVTGKVANVYSTERARDASYVDTLYALEVVVSGIEKGEGIAVEQVIFVKAWQMKKRPRGWAGPSGQDVIPKRGQTVKLFLTGKEGNYDALSPNGIAVVQSAKAQ